MVGEGRVERMDQVAMGAVDLEDLEAGGERTHRGGAESIDQPLDLRDGELARHRAGLFLRDRAGADGLPGRLRTVGLAQWRRAIPRAHGAAAAAGMADLDAGHRA